MLYYIGDGTRFPGVPTRDLTKEEVEALDAALVTALLAQGLYTRTKPASTSTTQPVAADAPAPAKDTKP